MILTNNMNEINAVKERILHLCDRTKKSWFFGGKVRKEIKISGHKCIVKVQTQYGFLWLSERTTVRIKCPDQGVGFRFTSRYSNKNRNEFGSVIAGGLTNLGNQLATIPTHREILERRLEAVGERLLHRMTLDRADAVLAREEDRAKQTRRQEVLKGRLAALSAQARALSEQMRQLAPRQRAVEGNLTLFGAQVRRLINQTRQLVSRQQIVGRALVKVHNRVRRVGNRVQGVSDQVRGLSNQARRLA